jgi:hypothetical protein
MNIYYKIFLNLISVKINKMASNNSDEVENLITCGLCSELYVDPRLLPCSHIYCARCIHQKGSINNNNHFQCPLCNQTKITINDIDSLPPCRIVHDIVELHS